MTIAGSSTPSSGGEHLIPHWLEMHAHRHGREPALHGLQVGIGTLVALALYEMWLETEPKNWQLPKDEPHPSEQAKGLERRYGAMAERVLTEFSAKWLTRERAEQALQKLATHWDGLRERLNQLRMLLALSTATDDRWRCHPSQRNWRFFGPPAGKPSCTPVKSIAAGQFWTPLF